MLGIVGGIANGKKKTTDSASSSGRGSVATDISEENLKGIYNGMSGEDFQKTIDKLGKPDLMGRQIPAARHSCKHMAAWKKRDGSYLLGADVSDPMWDARYPSPEALRSAERAGGACLFAPGRG